MERQQIINEIIKTVKGVRYLEIGVETGKTFFEISCDKKFAVDPAFLFEMSAAGPLHANSTFYDVSSDRYFEQFAQQDGPFDVIFLDGLHTITQSIRDLMNAIAFLNKGGVIVIDDVRPNSYAASLESEARARSLKSAIGDSDGSWMGNVFKIVPFIEAMCQQYTYTSPSELRNCLVIWRARGGRLDLSARSIKDIIEFTYEDSLITPGLYRTQPFNHILQLIAQDLAAVS